MAVRLRPQSSAWLAPTALAAQLTAQTGQIAGQGVAGLLGGIAQGVGAFTQKREQRRVEAINESRYQDSLTRQDRAFQYGAAKDQMSLLEDYLKGAEVEAALSAMSSPTGAPDPSKVQNLRTAQSSAQALRAQLGKIGGVEAANIPPMPAAPPAPVPTGQMPGVQERLAKVESFESLSVPELETISAGLASEAESIQAEMDAMLKVGGTKAAAMLASKRTALTEKSRDAMIASSVLKRKMASEKQAQDATEAKAASALRIQETEAEAKVRAEVAAKGDAESLAKLQSDVKALGGPEFKSADAAKSWLIENRQATSREATHANRMEMKRLGHEQAMERQDKAKANRIEIDAVAAANRVDASPEFKSAKDVAIRLEELAESKRRDFVWASENAKPEVATAARAAYDRALAEYETQVRKMATFATQDSNKAPKPAGAPATAAPSGETTEERLSRIFGR